MVTFKAYADPKTDWCHRVVRILSMIEVGPRDMAMAKIPNDAAVPDLVAAKLTRIMLKNMPIPHAHTRRIRYFFQVSTVFQESNLQTLALFPKTSMKMPRHGTKKNPFKKSE